MALKIALSEEKLAQLMRAGNLHPSELVCLDKATRDTIKNLCLQLCSQTQCHQCALNGLCGQEISARQPLPMPVQNQSASVFSLNSLN